MHKIEMLEAKKRLSELVERANRGEQIGITRRGKLAAVIMPARAEVTPQDIFDDIERIRKRARRTKTANIKGLIEKGRL
jgi:prevent-host-death family protein